MSRAARNLMMAMCCFVPLSFAACSDDDDDDKNDNKTTSAGVGDKKNDAKAGSGATAGKGGSDATKPPTGGTSSSDATAKCDLSGEGKDHKEIPNPTGDITLTADTVWELKDITHVADGTEITIEPCTRIEGQAGTPPGTLVVSRGARIIANGTADAPILFTSALPEGEREAGSWGGVVLLGKAPNFRGDEVLIEGLADAPENHHGGSAADDDSGSLQYVRIEFGGFELSAGNEINGLTLGSVGSKTKLSHIMVNSTLDDCFEWFGGTVNADHLICNGGGDDMFDADQGYIGTLQYLFGRQITASSMDPNGFEMDSNPENTDAPVTKVTATHATLCGTGKMGEAVSRGMVLRENLTGALEDIVITGFDIGADTRDAFGTPEEPNVTIDKSLLYGGRIANVGAEEVNEPGMDQFMNNDMGFDENEWFAAGTDNSDTPDPEPFTVADCQAEAGPAAAVLDSKVGAFASDAKWAQGLWVSWETE